MAHICTNQKCRKPFFGKTWYVGLHNSPFCSAVCKSTHVYDAEDIKYSTLRPLNTFQCPHCNEIISTSNISQKICQKIKCQAAQRVYKAKLREKKYLEELEKRNQKRMGKMNNERTEEMEIAMINAIAQHSGLRHARNCKYCNEIFTPTDKGKVAKSCGKEECKKAQKFSYYQKQQAKWVGREDEQREYYRQCNQRQRDKAKLTRLALQGIAKTPTKAIVTPAAKTITPPAVAIAIDEHKKERWIATKEHVAALEALVNGSTNKYQPLIYYLEANKINDMSKMSELMAIIGKITSND